MAALHGIIPQPHRKPGYLVPLIHHRRPKSERRKTIVFYGYKFNFTCESPQCQHEYGTPSFYFSAGPEPDSVIVEKIEDLWVIVDMGFVVKSS